MGPFLNVSTLVFTLVACGKKILEPMDTRINVALLLWGFCEKRDEVRVIHVVATSMPFLCCAG